MVTEAHGDHRLFFVKEISVGRHGWRPPSAGAGKAPIGSIELVGEEETRVATVDPETGTL
jgi:hypothetical protein